MLAFLFAILSAPPAGAAAGMEVYFERAGAKISLGSPYLGNVCGGGVPIEGGKATVYCRSSENPQDFQVAGIYSCLKAKIEGLVTLTPCQGLRVEALYLAGKLQGLHQIFYPNGKLAQEENFHRGKKHGPQKKFREDGVVTELVDYQQGQRHGRNYRLSPLAVRYFKQGKDQGPSDYFPVNKQEQLILAAASGNLPEIDSLLAKGAKPGSVGETIYTLETPLHAAAEFGQLAALKKLVSHDPAAVNAFDKQKQVTALHRAILHPEAVEYLLSQAAAPNLAGRSGTTALHEAARHGQLESVKALLRQRASPLLLDRNGNTPYNLVKPGANAAALKELLWGKKTVPRSEFEITWAACEKDSKKLPNLTSLTAETLARFEGCPPGSLRTGDLSQALAGAANRGDLPAAEILVQAGAVLSPSGNVPPLVLASRVGALPLVKFFLNSGAAVDEAGPDGQTALIAAAGVGNLDLVRLLLSSGAKREIKDKKAKMAVDYAREKKMKAVVDLLIDYR
jgi:ankyrin repeat protein